MDGQSKKSFWKFAGVFMALVLVVFGGLVVWKVYEVRRGREQIDKLAEKLKELERLDYEKAMADTYGGKTPQETLRLYIEAVEKGDYELASRYLVEDKRENEVKNLNGLASNQKLQLFLEIIRRAEPDGIIEDNNFRMKSIVDSAEGPYYFIRFIKYPNGIWKIIEI